MGASAGPFVVLNYAQPGDSWVATCANESLANHISRQLTYRDFSPTDVEVWDLSCCLTTPQAAAELACSVRFLDGLIRAGRLPACREGVGVRATYFVRREDLHLVPPGRGKGGKGGVRRKRREGVAV